MKNVSGLIYTTKDDLTLRELTSTRAVAALPVAGRYRIVDFILSSMVNSGVRSVGVITQKNYHSLMDHLGAGKEWDLHMRNDGLFILPPFLTRDNGGEYAGLLDALHANLHFLRRSRSDLVILTGSQTVMNTSFDAMLQQHEDTDADITLMYAKMRPAQMDLSSKETHAYLQTDREGRVVDMEVNPNAASYENLFLDTMIIKRTLLIHLVDSAFAHGLTDMVKDLLQPCVKNGSLKICGYAFTGYFRRIETIKSYFNFNMDLLNHDIRSELFSAYPVYTKDRGDVPALYADGACVRNSLIADGCVIEGTVENSVLFRGVHISRGTVVRNSIIMQDSNIEENVELENVILDKDVTVRSHGRLIGQKQYPIVIGKNVTL